MDSSYEPGAAVDCATAAELKRPQPKNRVASTAPTANQRTSRNMLDVMILAPARLLGDQGCTVGPISAISHASKTSPRRHPEEPRAARRLEEPGVRSSILRDGASRLLRMRTACAFGSIHGGRIFFGTQV